MDVISASKLLSDVCSFDLLTSQHTEIEHTDKMRSLTKEAPFWDTLGVYFDLEAVSRSTYHRSDSPGTSTPSGNEDEDRLFIFLAKRKRTGANSEKTTALPKDLMHQKDGQFEELLMLQSMADNAFS
jgi:hypothetical protein